MPNPRTPEGILRRGRLRIARQAWAALTIAAIVAMVLALLEPLNDPFVTVLFYAPMLVASGLIRLAIRAGKVDFAGWSLATVFFTASVAATFLVGTIQGESSMTFVIAIMVGAAVVGRRAALFWGAACLIFATLAAVAEVNGLMPEPMAPQSILNSWIGIVVSVAITAYLIHLSLQLREAALEAAAERQRERDRAEADLVQAQKMDVVGRLAGGIAHDFNNLLTVILSASDLMRITDSGDEELLDDIDRAVGRAGLLTNRLLTFGTPREIQPSDVDIVALLDEFSPLLDRLLGDEIRLILDQDPGAVVRLDPVAFEQVILNLVINAKQALGGTGTIDIGVHHDGDEVVLTLGDNGPGIPEEIRDRIFEPFFSTKERGTGLGLSTVQRLVQQSGGTIELLESESGGALFSIRWPGGLTKQATSSGSSSDSGETAIKPDVLLIEDNEFVRRATRQVLTARGWRVTEASDGLEALSIMQKREFDLVITDNAMHAISGAEVVMRMREKGNETPALIVSGNPAEVDLPDRASFLAKPYGELALIEAALSLLRDRG